MLDEVWVHAIGGTEAIVGDAVTAESEGWDGIYLSANPLTVPDPWVAMALAARETKRLRFGTGVLTPVSQIAATVAGSATTVHQTSGGRVVVGLGRGDHTVAMLGMDLMPLETFERYLTRVQSYLRGEQVPFDIDLDGRGLFPPAPADGHFGTTSALSFHVAPDSAYRKVPVEIFGSGPRVLAVGARHADRLTVAVGGDPARVAWALSIAQEAMARAGRDPHDVQLGAVVPVCVHPDREQARRLVRGAVTSSARFVSMQGFVPEQVSDTDKEVYLALRSTDGHEAASAEFIDRYAILGSVDECVERLEQLVALGITRIAFGLPLITPSMDTPTVDALHASRQAIIEVVVPRLRRRPSSR